MENRTTRFRKIPLKNLIDVLISLYHGGADYVDIMGEQGETQDEIGFAVKEEYMAPEDEMEYDDEENIEESFDEKNLTDLI